MSNRSSRSRRTSAQARDCQIADWCARWQIRGVKAEDPQPSLAGVGAIEPTEELACSRDRRVGLAELRRIVHTVIDRRVAFGGEQYARSRRSAVASLLQKRRLAGKLDAHLLTRREAGEAVRSVNRGRRSRDNGADIIHGTDKNIGRPRLTRVVHAIGVIVAKHGASDRPMGRSGGCKQRKCTHKRTAWTHATLTRSVLHYLFTPQQFLAPPLGMNAHTRFIPNSIIGNMR